VNIANETKVGAIAVVAVTFLILGFNFLKGKKFFTTNTTLIGIYGNVHGLANSNPITVNGLQVGTIYSISTQKDMRRISVAMNITKDINIPDNSVALIKPNPLGTTTIEIKLGNSPTYLKNKDTIFTEANAGIFDEVLKKADPVLYELKRAIGSLDTLIVNFNSVLDPRTKGNITSSMENLHKITTSLTHSSASLQALLNSQTGALAKTLNNMNSVTANLAANNPKINTIVSNLDATTTQLSQLQLKKTMDTLDMAVNTLNNVINNINSDKGTLGKLMNDPTLYKNLASTGNKLNLLLDDIRLNPKRYVSISLIGGRKSSGGPLMVPLPDTVSSPYIIKKVDD
jgi:phospholipid/cholesterol/gamma-HCH transport system substrate-binding protein